MSAIQIMLIQWESEYWTCPVYEWFQPVLLTNAQVSNTFFKTGQEKNGAKKQQDKH